MSQKKWLVAGAVILVLCIIPIAGLGIVFFQPWLLNPLMPLYAYKIVPSTHDGYSRHILMLGNIAYESDYAEYGLSAPGNDHQIGQTSLGGRIYTIPGQENYVVLYDFMSPVGVFRNSQHPAFDWRTANFKEMQLYPLGPGINTAGSHKTTTDSQLIQEMLSSLKDGTVISSSQVTGSTSSYALYLYSDQLPGMTYCVGVYVDSAGQVYVAENTISKQWHQASPLFSEWAKSP